MTEKEMIVLSMELGQQLAEKLADFFIKIKYKSNIEEFYVIQHNAVNFFMAKCVLSMLSTGTEKEREEYLEESFVTIKKMMKDMTIAVDQITKKHHIIQ